MSDEGEKTCPLCAEEMDLTDQQLKPCKCGYEICVWCWHHIMDMAEKDDSEGRCPACRAPYNKEKIVGMAASCERLVAEMSMEKKVRSQKGKNKTTEGRKQLSSVRVIQRNLVYIVGLPLNLADEDLLQRKEYFAQYGKVLKVSISRTAAGTIQHFANNTCSVYITYSKEEEAVRCIQSVHGYILEGRPLRACFGTTKYCHAWLRNVPCSNPDCLYLHEIGSQEDSFTKDEIISAYTRSRVQQITGATNSTQRRSGNVLPAPADDYCNNSSSSSAKPITKNAANNSTSSIRISPPNSSSGRSVALPAGASWGTRASSSQPASGSLPSSNGPFKNKLDTVNGPVTFSSALACSNLSPTSHSDVVKKLGLDDESHSTQEESKPTSETAKHLSSDRLTSLSDGPLAAACHTTTTSSKPHSPRATRDKDKFGSLQPIAAASVNLSLESGGVGSVKDTKDNADEKCENSRTEISSGGLDGHQGLEHGYIDNTRELLTSQSATTAVVPGSEFCVSGTKSDLGLDSEIPQMQAISVDDKDDVLSFDNQRLKDPEVVTDSSYFKKFSHSLHPSNSVRGLSPLFNGSLGVNENFQIVDKKVESISQSTSTPVFYSGYPENQSHNFASLSNNVEHPYIFSHDDKTKNNGRFESELSSVGRNGAADIGESSIISNILSLDLDSWDESLTSPHNFAKLLGEPDKRQQSLGVSNPWKLQQSNQSRFSFAREEEPAIQALDTESSLNYVEQAFRPDSYGREFANKTSYHLDRFGSRNGFSLANAEEPDPYSSHPYFSSSKIPASRSQVSAPPGFSTPNRAPPPGFTSHERLDHASVNSLSGHHMFEASSLLRNQYQAPQSGNLVSNGDIEFMDPAILAVGKGRLPDGLHSSGLDMRSNISSQLNTFESDARLQLLMQRSLSSHQNPRFEMGDPFSSLADTFRIPSRVMEQSLANNLSPFPQVGLPQSRNTLMSNGHWDSWNEVQGGNNMGMSELLRSERLGFNKFYNGYEDSKLRMPSQGDLYNRTFGI